MYKTMTATIRTLTTQKECTVCLFTEDIARIDDSGVCEYCKLQKTLRNSAQEPEWPAMLQRIKNSGVQKQYDCAIGISGGEDSSILLYLAVRVWNLRPLVIHFDNRWNSPEANHNIELLTEMLGVNFIRYYLDQPEYNVLNDAFLAAGVPDADIPNDIAMTKLMYETARQYGIKYTLNGHDFRREGSSPAAWSYMDAKYIASVYRSYTGRKLENYPLYTFWDQIWASVLGIKQVRVYHYSDHARDAILKTIKSFGWKEYGAKHAENVYTEFVGNYLLPRKFGIDKRRTYLSAQIREGFITKEYAKEILQSPPEFDLNKLGEIKDHIMHLVNSSRIQPRTNFARYNFKRWKLVIWLLMKMGICPRTFYFKYTKKY